MAMKIQAIGSGQGQKFYTVPKHYGRNEEQVYMNLSKSDTVLLIAYDNHSIDEQTADELKYLESKNKKTVAIVPNDFTGLSDSKALDIYRYKRTDQFSLLNAIQEYLGHYKETKKQSDDSTNVFAAIMMLVVGLLLIAFIKDDSK
jgi:hypothetical protein